MNEDMSYRNAFIDDLYCKNYVILKGSPSSISKTIPGSRPILKIAYKKHL